MARNAPAQGKVIPIESRHDTLIGERLASNPNGPQVTVANGEAGHVMIAVMALVGSGLCGRSVSPTADPSSPVVPGLSRGQDIGSPTIGHHRPSAVSMTRPAGSTSRARTIATAKPTATIVQELRPPDHIAAHQAASTMIPHARLPRLSPRTGHRMGAGRPLGHSRSRTRDTARRAGARVRFPTRPPDPAS
jgi:hypothetical protein